MHLTQPLTRAFVSLAFTIALAALLVFPHIGNNLSVLARPLQVATPQLSPASQSRDAVAGTASSVTFELTLRNVGDTSDSFTLALEDVSVISGASATLNTGSPVTIAAGGSLLIQVTVNIPATATANQQDIRRLRATANSNNATVFSTLTTNIVGATATATITPTPTGTAGPTPTPGPVCRDPYESDDTLAQAREILPDVQQTHVICPTGDEDWLVFGGVAGKVYTIDVPAVTAGLDLTLSLYDSAGNLLAFNNDFPRNNDPTDIKPRIQSWRAPANGRYFIKVRDDAGRGGTSLSYNVILNSESYGPTPTLVAELCSDLFEPDGVPEQARLMVVRETQPNHRFCPAGDADWVRFFAKASERYVLRTDSKGRAGADPVLILVDRDGATILDLNDDNAGTLDARIEFQVPVDGYYYAQVKNVGDVGNQFIAYDLTFEPLGAPAAATSQPTTAATTPTTTGTAETITPTTTGTPGTTTPTTTGTATTTTPGACPTASPYPPGCPGASSLGAIKDAPAFVNGPARGFVDPAMRNVWSRTDQVVAARQIDRSWMWGPSGLVARAETYTQANGGARQVEYFDKARMEITDWSRDRTNPWFVTNGLLVKELIEGRLQIGDSEFVNRAPANINVAGDADDSQGPTYASFAGRMARAENRVGQIATDTLARNGSIGTTAERPEAKLATYVPETGHNIPQVFWDFLNARGPVGDGKQSGVLVDWVFAMGYPISEPYWTKVKVGGVERDVLVQAFQRRMLTYTPSNPDGWKVEMGNVGRHYYLWRYGKQP